ncbi:MAG: amino acid ABC transporter permease [Proteobacteria bacterium]|nr:amino acid ABC transporter permease [Pseudomonadota bacterium]
MAFWLQLLPAFTAGFLESMKLALIASAVAFPLGCCIGVGRIMPIPVVRRLSDLYINLVRSTPIPVILIFFFFALPDVGLKFSALACAAAGLGLYMASYVAEALRSGVNAVPTGYIEAARALGLPERTVIGGILVPQALKAVIPTLGNLSVDLIKNTSIAYTISVVELTGTAVQQVTMLAKPIPIFILAAVGYAVMTFPTGAGFRALERKFKYR